jgi:purine-nucleoside phosphorylase
MQPVAPYAELVQAARRRPPSVAIVLGTGLGDLAAQLDDARAVPFALVPGLCGTSVPGHRGQLLHGAWAGQTVLVFAGRLHGYEGHPWRSVVQPIHAARELGAHVLLLTNAAGGIRDDLGPGSLMAVRDHVDGTHAWWWRRPGPGGVGPRRPSPYSQYLFTRLFAAARRLDIELAAGVYAQVTGPCYETKAEIRALARCGVDAVGMSTAREVEAGHELGMLCAALSCITNRAAGLSDGPLQHDEVLAAAAQQRQRLTQLIEGFLRAI